MNEDYYYTDGNEGIDYDTGYDFSGVDSGEFDDSQDYGEEDLRLGFINHVGTEIDGINEYEAIFTTHPDEFWGENFNYKPASVCNGLHPELNYIQKIVKFKSIINLDLIQNSGCFSMQDCMDGIVALAYQNLEGLDEYPENGRLYLMFGETYKSVETKLARCHILID